MGDDAEDEYTDAQAAALYALRAIPGNDLRLEVLRAFCSSCGSVQGEGLSSLTGGSCQCWNDE